MGIPDEAVSRRALAVDAILIERHRQDAKWGEQNHPSLHWALDYGYIPSETRARGECESAFELGYGSWTHIAFEEFCEAVHAPDEAHRREELVQLAAVCLAWIECIDRNR